MNKMFPPTMSLMMTFLFLMLMLLFYAMLRRVRIDSSAEACSDKFCEKIKTASTEIQDTVDVDKMFYTNEEVFWRFWDWSKECSIRDRKMYYDVVGK